MESFIFLNLNQVIFVNNQNGPDEPYSTRRVSYRNSGLTGLSRHLLGQPNRRPLVERCGKVLRDGPVRYCDEGEGTPGEVVVKQRDLGGQSLLGTRRTQVRRGMNGSPLEYN
ncbi:hypothetical protein GOBAR_DD25455 [Gossypium barbadense]|nr:hypothetical protein GOBAR_DD25455 [Gossypium barbadense]